MLPTAPAVVGEGHAPPGDALTVRTSHRQNGKRPRIVIARPRRGRGNLAVPCRISGKPRRKRDRLREIATSAVGLLAMTNLGAIAFLILARTSRRCSAGRGMPLPYNTACGRRWLVRAATAFPRLPRRFAPRNDTSRGVRRERCTASIWLSLCRFADGPGCPRPYNARPVPLRNFPYSIIPFTGGIPCSVVSSWRRGTPCASARTSSRRSWTASRSSAARLRPFRPEYSTASPSSRSIPPLQPSRGNSVSSRCATTGPATG